MRTNPSNPAYLPIGQVGRTGRPLYTKGVIRIRIFLWVVLAVIIGWLLYMAVVPGGKISYEWEPGDDNFFIGKLTPEEKVQTPLTPLYKEGEEENPLNPIPPSAGLKGVNIVGDPVYFSLRTPRRFEKAKLVLKYKENPPNPSASASLRRDGPFTKGVLPIIEAGVLADKTIWRYNLKPIENKIIDELAGKWNVIKENSVILLQRNKKYGSVGEFLNNLPARNEIALYNYSLKSDFRLLNYKPAENGVNIDHPLRGPYQILTYIKNEDLDFEFEFFDLNENKDSDAIDLNLYRDNELVTSRHLDDDPSASSGQAPSAGSGQVADGVESAARKLKLSIPGLAEGDYKIELKVNDDIITKNITTKQQKLSFLNKIWLADGGGQNISLYTDGKTISAQTINPARLQDIKIGDKKLAIDKTYKQFNADIGGGVKKIELENDDVIIAGDGVFSFASSSLINPAFKKIDGNTDIDDEGVSYVLANYKKPREEDGWKTAEADFNISNAYREKGEYNFLISIPGLRTDDGIEDNLEIGEIRVELEGRSLREKIFNFQ